jgi:outer membrane protein TolC
MMQYPDLNVSAQYLHLFDTAKVDLKTSQPENTEEEGTEETSGGASPSPSYLMFGMASVSMPVFSGFKLRNSIKQSEYAVNLSKIQMEEKKEDVVYQILQIYFSLYKTKKSLEVLKENEIRAEQRATDFKNFMDNGLLARNDYLRSTLQLSNVKLAEEEAKTSYDNLNYQLNILLGLPEETKIEIENIENLNVLPNADGDLSNRKDLQSMEEQIKIADSQIKIEKGNYYPTLSLSGGYAAIDIDDVATVTNATNAGIGLSYNLASIFKNKAKVEEAKAEKMTQEALLEAQKDQAKVEIKKAFNDYNLALKKENVFEEAKTQADENYRIVKDKYDNGLSDTDQLLEADIEQLQAQINQTIGDVDTLLALYKYVYTQGKLMEVLQ